MAELGERVAKLEAIVPRIEQSLTNLETVGNKQWRAISKLDAKVTKVCLEAESKRAEQECTDGHNCEPKEVQPKEAPITTRYEFIRALVKDFGLPLIVILALIYLIAAQNGVDIIG